MTKLRENYKEYNGKLIPKDWEGLKIGDIVKFEGGAQPPKSEFKSVNEEGYVRLIQIRDYKSDNYITFIPENLARKFCDETDVMIGRYGPPIFQILRGIKGAYNVALMKAIPDEDKVSKDYIYYYLQIDSLFKIIDKLSRRSSGQTGVDLDALNTFDIPLPSLKEQNKIVNLIKEAEDLVEKQEQLIEKKKEFKKGLMQRFLSGEVRFKEFNKEWKTMGIGEFAISISELNKDNSDLTVLSCTKYDGLVESLKYFGKKMFSDDISKYKKVWRNDFAYATNHIEEGSIGVQRICEVGLVSPMYTVFRVDTTLVDIDYLFYLLKTDRYISIYKSRMTASVDRRGSLRWSEFSKIKLYLPCLEEQRKISEVLTLSDKEIELLEKELESLKLQKKGLMQRLLTGEVRVKV